MKERERHVGAKNHAAVAREPIGEALRQRAHAGYRRHAERDAGEKDTKAGDAGAQLAQREPEHQPRVQALTSRAVSMRPERSRTTRSQRAASSTSWVTSTSVVSRRA